MLQIRTEINGEVRFLDLYEDEDIKLDYSFAEVQDITKKNSTFSKSFTLPGSKNNNDIFNHFYNLNTTPLDYDVRRVFNASLVYEGQTILTGYMRLNNVSINNTEVIYNVTFYSEVGNLVTNIGDKFLYDLDYSELAHPYDDDIVISSLYDTDFSGGTEPYNDGRVYFTLANFGYEYSEENIVNTDSTPIIDFRDGQTPGYFDAQDTPLRFYYLKPSIQIKWFYEKIFEEAGYKVKSDFFETAYFKRFYLPLTFSKDSLYLNQAIKPQFEFRNETNEYGGDMVTGTTINWSSPPPYTSTKTGLWRIEQQVEIVNNINAHQFGTTSFKVPQDGYYRIKINMAGYNSERAPDSIPLDALLQVFFNQIEVGGSNGLSGTTLATYPTPTQFLTISAGGTFQFGWEVRLYLQENKFYSIDADYSLGIGDAIITLCNLQILDGPRSIIGDIDYKLELPENEIKQIDFISSMNKYWNLIVVEDKDEEKTLRVEPLIDYIGTGEVLDWTTKLDRKRQIQILPTTNTFYGTLSYENKLDRDYGNDEFNKKANKVFGTQLIRLDQDIKNQDIPFNFIHANSVDYTLNNIGVPNATLPIFFVTSENDNEGVAELYFLARKTLPRIYFRGINLPAKNVGYINATGTTILNTWYLESQKIDMFPVGNRYTTYPLGISGFTHAINYDKTDIFDEIEYDFTGGLDMYDIYYKEYKEDLTSEESRIFVGYFYLTPYELQALKGNEKIYLDGNYFRINKINQYSLTGGDIAKVELLKLTRDYQPHKKLCYALIDCDAEENIIYTSTDNNYTWWAYEGYSVKINGRCYTISGVTCNDNYNYQTIEIPFQPNSFLPGIYTNCACETYIDSIGIYNDIARPIPPAPSPTPSGETYYYYIIEKCNVGTQALARSTTPYFIGTSVNYTPDGNGCWFIKYYSNIPNTNDITATYTDCEDCTLNAPTPTPTATPQPTPTPTTTPYGCFPCYEWEIDNTNNPIWGSYNYTDCATLNTIFGAVPPYQYAYVCSCEQPGTQGYVMPVTLIGECEGNPPAPSPSPTSSLTPTPTPTPSALFQCPNGCVEYSVYNPFEGSCNLYYVDCFGNSTSTSIGGGFILTICACEGSLLSECNLIYTEIGSCSPVPLPSQTPTPSVSSTPAVTPSPTSTPVVEECYCYTYYVTSNEADISYTNCDGIPVNIPGISSGATYQVCSLTDLVVTNGTAVVSKGDLCIDGSCPTTPTPTPTITPTSTPVPGTPHNVNECFATCVEGECFCDSATPTIIYMAPGLTPDMFGENVYADPGLTTLWYGDYQYTGGIYNASPITLVCLVGGGC